jgi:hypothetical protein
MIRALVLTVGALVVSACGSKNPAGPCDTDPPSPECMQACDPAPGAPNTCPPGWHCTPDGLCFAACTQGGSECGSNAYCSPDGECIPIDGDAALGPDADCPDVMFTATRVTPSIELLIDQSGSMAANFGGVSRYTALRNALVSPGGVVDTYQASVYFGATLYTSGTTCPRLTRNASGRQLNNLVPIRSLINGNTPSSETPTGESLAATWMDFGTNPPPPDSPAFIVLATDGEPDVCADGNDVTAGRARSVLEAQNAFAANVRTFVLSVGTDVANNHLQRVANAGAGLDPTTGNAPYYVANDPAALAAAFDTIIGGVVSCDLQLDGDISPDQAASGEVYLDGNLLAYGSDWTLVGSDIIRLTGQACTDLQNSTNPMVTANFPCGAVID